VPHPVFQKTVSLGNISNAWVDWKFVQCKSPSY